MLQLLQLQLLLLLMTTTTIMLYLFTVVELLSRALLKVWDLHPDAVRDFILHFSSLTTMCYLQHAVRCNGWLITVQCIGHITGCQVFRCQNICSL